MMQFIIEKMMHKKWMMLCLLIGNILLIGIAICNPVYYHAALDKMLQQELEKAGEEQGFSMGAIQINGTNSIDYKSKKATEVLENDLLPDFKQAPDFVEKYFGIPLSEKQLYTAFPSSSAEASFMGGSRSMDLSVANLSELEKHVKITAGKLYKGEIKEGEPLECIITEQTLVQQGFMLNQEVQMTEMSDEKTGKPLTLKIVGVFKKKELDDPYWVTDPAEYKTELFVPEQARRKIYEDVQFQKGNTVSIRVCPILDTKYIKSGNLEEMRSKGLLFKQDVEGNIKGVKLTLPYISVIEQFLTYGSRIRMTMYLLQIPMLVLLAVFIFMVNRQIIGMEQAEIAMMKSRGVSRLQLIGVYFLQSVLINLLSLFFAVPLGIFLCQVIGASNAFMEFVNRRALEVSFTWDILLYAGGGILFSMIMLLLPVIPASRVGIVEQKQGQKEKKPFFRRFFLDIILIAVALYAYYNYTARKEELAESIANGGGIDPLLLIASSLFVLGCALLALRIIPAVVWVIYRIGKKRWSPAMYASFLEMIRGGSRQGFIIFFLAATIAFGIFNATMARTINGNEEDKIQYRNGADIVLQEKWESNYATAARMKDMEGIDIAITYEEPDYMKYAALQNQVESMTRVLNVRAKIDGGWTGEEEEAGDVYGGSHSYPEEMAVEGIEPKEFGETAWFRDNLTKEHWFHLLNKLAETPDGIVLSSNIKENFNVAEGDIIQYSIQDELGRGMTMLQGKVVGFIEYFPGFQKETREEVSGGKYNYVPNYLLIANLDYILDNYGMLPYRIYIRTKGGHKPVYDFIEKNHVAVQSITDSENDRITAKNEPVLQVSNGILTIAFIVVLLLCTTGFLIYWILSIRSRELLFGIYRAMGLGKRELFMMLLNEHIFSTLFSIGLGILTGMAAAKLFVPMVEMTYFPEQNLIPAMVITAAADMVKIGVIVILMISFCIAVLTRLLAKLKISQALKLGED